MEFFVQELTLAAFFTVMLYWVLAISVSFNGDSSSSTNRDSSFDHVNDESVAKDDILSSGLRVTASKGKKTVTFVDDEAVITNVDRYDNEELSESAVSLGDDVESMRDLTVDEERLSDTEKDGSGIKILGEEGINVRETYDFDADDEGSEKIETPIEEKCDDGDNLDGALRKKDEDPLEVIGLKRSEVADSEHKNDDTIYDRKEANEFRAAEAIEGLKTSPVNEVEVRNDNVDDIGDDWEGIERSELEKKFAQAVNYVEYGRKEKEKDDDQSAKLGFDEQMQLYGLHKLAVEGPCFEPQPMALKVSARAKWNAWQRLGNMSPETAMEQYIKVLADYNPQWMHGDSSDFQDDKE